MLSATSYIIDQDGTIFNQDGVLIRTTKGFPTACDIVKGYITNARSKNYKEEWVIMGDTISYIVV